MWDRHRKLVILIGVASGLAGLFLVLHVVLPALGDNGQAYGRPDLAGKVSESDGAGEPDGAPDGSAGSPAGRITQRDLLDLARQPRPEDLEVFQTEAQSDNWKNRYAAVTGLGRLDGAGDPELLLSILNNSQ